MLDLSKIPPDVSRLAAACLVQNVTAQQLMHTSPEECAEFAREAGFSSFDDFLAAVHWVSDFFLARTSERRN
jgi:hypothetical protein